jgi:UDP-3-O-[3-hydroxymyristoyl] glucosamine N-acyltransferase
VDRAFRLGELAERVGGRVLGDPGRVIRGVATLESAGPDELSFLTHPRYRRAAASTRAGALLVAPGAGLAGGPDLLEVPEPYLALAEILECFEPPAPGRPGVSPDARLGRSVALGLDVEIGPFAVVGDEVALGDRCAVGAGCVIGDGCVIGAGTVLRPRVVAYPGTRIGRGCLIHSGVVLGADGFGFATSRGKHRKIPQLGRVVVGDDVEIGANSTVDRGTLGETVIGSGTKIDNLVMIGHGAQIGPDGLLVAQVGIAGSTRLGARVKLAGQSGVIGHLALGDDVKVAAKAAVFDDVPAGSTVAGAPAVDIGVWRRSQALARRLPELRDRLRRIEARLDRLEAELGAQGVVE